VLPRSRRYGSREGITPQSTLVALIFHVAAVRTTMALGSLVRAIYTAAQSRLCVPPTAYHTRQRGVGCTSQEDSREERGGCRNEYGAGIDGGQEWWRRSCGERFGKPGCLRAGTILSCDPVLRRHKRPRGGRSICRELSVLRAACSYARGVCRESDAPRWSGRRDGIQNMWTVTRSTP
jgi:hypothetical protein